MKLKKVMLTLTLVFVTGAFQMPVHAAEESAQVTAQENEQSVDATEAQETDTEVIGETLGANTNESDFNWNGTIITGYTGSATDVVIPERATGIADSAFARTGITSITFSGNNMTTIGMEAFSGCSSLNSISFPASLKSIGYRAFYGCSALQEVVIPENVQSIGMEAFKNCSTINKFNIKSSVLNSTGSGIFSGCSSLKTVTMNGELSTIPEGMFSGAEYITSITIPQTVTTIGREAFNNCTSLKQVVIPENVERLGDFSFNNCTSLKSVTFPSGLKNIDYRSFYNCTALQEVVIPENVQGIGMEAFAGCSALTKLTTKAVDTSWSYSVFSNDLRLVIYGLEGATIETYAKDNNIKFVSMGHAPGWFTGSDGQVRYYDKNGNMVKNQFAFDGKYTYYLQADGSPMKDRLTYHPDGQHIIYFDSDGHEVFNSFQYCPSVGYTCYFDSQGYIYKDQITFVGDKVYYLNANGKMEQNGWFQFANGRDFGYANSDGTLKTDGFSYDPWGRIVFYHWNGMVARGLITDGAYYYNMDATDGHYLGSFPVN